jgi:hypothetical protein
MERWRRVTPRSKLTCLGRHVWGHLMGIGWKASNSEKPREHQVVHPLRARRGSRSLSLYSYPITVHPLRARRGLFSPRTSVHLLRARRGQSPPGRDFWHLHRSSPTCTERSLVHREVCGGPSWGQAFRSVHLLRARRGRSSALGCGSCVHGEVEEVH